MISRTFQWTVGAHFLMILQLMKICTVTDAGQGLNNQPVRITEIQENEDFSLTITAEEFLGTASAPLYGLQVNSGFNAGFNADPGPVNPPVFVELPEQLSGGLAVTIGISGSNPELYGGCQIWISSDGEDYSQLNTFAGNTRMGVLSAPLPSVAAATAPPTIDSTNTLAVNLAESDAQLTSISPAAFAALATLSVVDSEIIAYENATLESANNYNLTTLARGTYLSTIAAHVTGAPFMRLDGSAYEWQFTPQQIGQTFYFKFLAYNQYGGGLETLDDVPAYTYTPTGAALSYPLAAPTALYTNFANGFEQIWFTEVVDPRANLFYEMRRGATAQNGAVIATQAHPPFTAPGAGTYWIAAKVTPTAGLTVYSAWQSITISANQLQQNTLTTYDDQAMGWAGTLGAGLGVQGTGTTKYLRLAGAGNILTTNPVLVSTTAAGATASGMVVAVASTTGISAGMAVSDKTTPSAIPANVTVASVGVGHVTLSAPVAGGGVLNADVLQFSIADVLTAGGIPTGAPAYYTSAEIVNAGYPAQISINASLAFAGLPIGANILADANVLTDPDVLNSSSTAYVEAWIEISLGSTPSPNDVFSLPDAFAPPDVFNPLVFGPWQRFMVGVFSCQAYQLRVAVQSNDPNTYGIVTAFNQSAQLPLRVDHYTNLTVPSTGYTVVFQPDYATSAGAFNAGPAGATLPYPVVAPNTLQPGDTPVISGESLSQLTLTIMNGGVAVSRTKINLTVEGF
jgi:hypothetical protein